MKLRGFRILHLKVIHVDFGGFFERVARFIAQKEDEAHRLEFGGLFGILYSLTRVVP